MELYNNISSVLSKKNGINLAVGDIYDYMQIWKEWLAGDVADFHHYKVKLASGTTVNKEILTMNMPNQAVAEEILKKIYGIENIKEEIDSVKLLEELKIKKVEMLGEETRLCVEEILDLLF